MKSSGRGGGPSAGDILRRMPAPRGSVALRAALADDAAWVTERHGAIYAAEFGWDASFEALVGEVMRSYVAEHDPTCEAGWIAEVDGRRAGSVFCIRQDRHTAKLRVLLVEPWARGRGIGSRLIAECISFARDAGYDELVLWTVDVLAGARRIYERAGFRLTRTEPAHRFGSRLVDEYWSLTL